MKKKLVVLSAVALTAAAAVPALAFENEFHGMYRLRGSISNFQDAGLSGTYGVTNAGTNDATKTTSLLSQQTRTYTLFEQRARLQYIAKASDDLKLVTHFEIDSSWGDAAYQTGRGIGGGLAADTVNLETKSVYIDFNSTFAPVNVKLGIQPWGDAYKGIFMSDDVGGAVATGKFGPATTTAAWFRTYDQGGTTDLGKKNVDVAVADVKYAITKDLKLGSSFYWANNDVTTARQRTYTYGLNAAAKLGVVDLDAFFLYQDGHELYATYTNPWNAASTRYVRDLQAFAGQVAAKANLGAVTVRAAGLYASGDDMRTNPDNKSPYKATSFQNIFASGAPGAAPGSSTSSGVYYSSQMLMLLRSVWAMDSDQSLVASINNNGAGLVAGFLGVDTKVNDKFTVNFNLGHAMVDKRNEAAWGISGTSRTTSKDIGTEANLQLHYKLYPNLTASLQGAYVLLGGYKKAGVATTAAGILNEQAYAHDVKDPYLGALMMNYTF